MSKFIDMNMTPFRSVIFSGFFLLIFLYSCVNHDLPKPAIDVRDCTSRDEISFASDVKPLVEQKCAFSGCHNGDNGADINWKVFANLQGHSAEVQNRITLPQSAAGHMPRVGSLTDEQIQTIYCWVAQGAKNN
jgi:hypothetical protein